ncbi:MAG: ABC transporter permease [SAR202 cluster bacterium]|nr:ABC transporter permease [SAR202 cluster bacterium]MDP6716736.1 ABC transporter permease [SAR202 cluster bacterium]
MTTPARQIPLSELEDLSRGSTIERTLYVFRRWPLIPMFILSILLICAVFSPLVAPYDPEKDQLRAVLASPPWYPACEEGQITNKRESCNTNGIELGRNKDVYHFILGADQLGRDLLSRIIYGARLSLSLAAVAIVVGTIFGTTVGLTAGYFGGIVDELLMRTVDVFNSIPYLLLAIALVFVLGQSFAVVAFVLALGAWGGIARLVRGQTLQVRNFDFIALATVAGASTPRIMMKHLLPAVSNTIIVATTLQVGSTILSESILSFLGAGVPPPTPSWGADISNGREYLGSAWWVAFFPGIAIFLTVLSFNFIGDWLRDRWDPRLRQI